MNTTALIMAGGRGERFWPRSRRNLPKQFLSLTDDGKTMIQLTVERILPLVKMEDIYIATNKNYRDLVRSQLPEIPEENILCEPVGRNTAPCIGLGAAHIGKKYEDALMLVLPSDHLIKFNNMFLSALRAACQVAGEGDNLVTLGITPTYPETGYGYIKFNPHATLGAAYEVERFVEKPTLEVAKEYLETEEYLWNSGMFIWKLSSIWKNLEKYMPETCSRLKTIAAAIGTPEEGDGAGAGVCGHAVGLHRLRDHGEGGAHLHHPRHLRLGRCGFLAGGGADQEDQRGWECGERQRHHHRHPQLYHPGERQTDCLRGSAGPDHRGHGRCHSHLREA